MGFYLTYQPSGSFATTGTYADENMARAEAAVSLPGPLARVMPCARSCSHRSVA